MPDVLPDFDTLEDVKAPTPDFDSLEPVGGESTTATVGPGAYMAPAAGGLLGPIRALSGIFGRGQEKLAASAMEAGRQLFTGQQLIKTDEPKFGASEDWQTIKPGVPLIPTWNREPSDIERLVSSMSTPGNIAMLSAGATKLGARALLPMFLAQLPPQLAEDAKAILGGEGTPEDKRDRINNLVVMAGITLRGMKPKASTADIREWEKPIGPLVEGRLLATPRGARPPDEPAAPLELLTPDQAAAQARAMQRRATAAYEPPKPPRAAVPEGPEEAPPQPTAPPPSPQAPPATPPGQPVPKPPQPPTRGPAATAEVPGRAPEAAPAPAAPAPEAVPTTPEAVPTTPEDMATAVGGVKFDHVFDPMPGRIKPLWQFTITEKGRETTFAMPVGSTFADFTRRLGIKHLQYDRGIAAFDEAEKIYDAERAAKHAPAAPAAPRAPPTAAPPAPESATTGEGAPPTVKESLTHGETVKQPWQMTRAEIVARDKAIWGDQSTEQGQHAMLTAHKMHVADALREGKPVSREVLADYPDLAKTAKPESTPPPATPAVELEVYYYPSHRQGRRQIDAFKAAGIPLHGLGSRSLGSKIQVGRIPNTPEARALAEKMGVTIPKKQPDYLQPKAKPEPAEQARQPTVPSPKPEAPKAEAYPGLTAKESARLKALAPKADAGTTTSAEAREYKGLVAKSKGGGEEPTAPGVEYRHAGIPIPGAEELNAAIVRIVQKTRRTIAAIAQTGDVRETMTYTRDAGDNMARRFARVSSNSIRNRLRRAMGRGTTANPLDEEALSFVREANGDPAKLDVMRQKLNASTAANSKWKARAMKAIDHGEANWNRLNPIADLYKSRTHAQITAENAAGINTPERDGYVMHAQDIPDVFGFLEQGTGGDFTGFKHIRTHDTFADSIAAGVDPKSINATDLLETRLSRGQQLINNRLWIEGLKTTIDPKTRQSIVTHPIVQPRGAGLPPDFRAPDGYEIEMAGGRPIAVLKGYAGIYHAITDPSWFRKSAGWTALERTAATGKSVALAVDTFHLGRLAFWESIIKPLSFHDPKLPLPSYKKGVLTLDYSSAELTRMAAAGEIPARQLPQVLAAKQDLSGLIKAGYNIGRVADMMHQEWMRKVPVLGAVNKFIFESFQRGAMAEIGTLEAGRYRRMNPSWSDERVYREVAKDLNTRFGNLGRQGWLRSKTAQDMARLAALAPQWNEGLIRAEAGVLTGAVKGIGRTAKEGRLSFGVLPRAVGAMMLAQFAANQLINYATRGHPTWDNPEEGFGAKLSAWVPDVVGGSSGFFLHPFGLAAEVTHLLSQKYSKTGDFRQSMLSFFGGRYSTIMRPVMTYVTGRLPSGARPIRSEDIYWETLKQSIPAPIGGSAVFQGGRQLATGEKSERFPGQFQKQIMASMGVKTDQAPSFEQRIGGLAADFRKAKDIKPAAEFYVGDYEDLTSSLRRGAVKEAEEKFLQLRKKKPDSQIIQHFLHYPFHPFTGSQAHELEFLGTLTDEQKVAYDKAMQSRAQTAQAFFDLVGQVANKQTK